MRDVDKWYKVTLILSLIVIILGIGVIIFGVVNGYDMKWSVPVKVVEGGQ